MGQATLDRGADGDRKSTKVPQAARAQQVAPKTRRCSGSDSSWSGHNGTPDLSFWDQSPDLLLLQSFYPWVGKRECRKAQGVPAFLAGRAFC